MNQISQILNLELLNFGNIKSDIEIHTNAGSFKVAEEDFMAATLNSNQRVLTHILKNGLVNCWMVYNNEGSFIDIQEFRLG